MHIPLFYETLIRFKSLVDPRIRSYFMRFD